MDLAKELISANDPFPLQLLIDSANVDSPDKYEWTLFDELINRFPDTGLAKLGKGYQLSKQGDIDQAFDLFGVSGLYININHCTNRNLNIYIGRIRGVS